MKAIFMITAALGLGLCLTLPAQEQPITLKTPTGELKGTLMLPAGEAPVQVVLIHAGSGPTDYNGNQPAMQNNSLKMIAEELYKNNIASVRFDKRGVAQSAGAAPSEKDLRFEIYVEDTKQWIALLAADKRFSKVIVMGHSEGSLIGMAASAGSSSVGAFISLAGAGRPADEILKEQLASQPQTVKDMLMPMIDKLKKGDTIGNVSPMLYSLFRPSVQPYMISWFKYNPQDEIRKLSIPILLVQGDKDIQVSLTDEDLLAAANTKALKKVIANMNHVLKDCTVTDIQQQLATYNNPELPLNKDFVTQLLAFIKDQK